MAISKDKKVNAQRFSARDWFGLATNEVVAPALSVVLLYGAIGPSWLISLLLALGGYCRICEARKTGSTIGLASGVVTALLGACINNYIGENSPALLLKPALIAADGVSRANIQKIMNGEKNPLTCRRYSFLPYFDSLPYVSAYTSFRICAATVLVGRADGCTNFSSSIDDGYLGRYTIPYRMCPSAVTAEPKSP